MWTGTFVYEMKSRSAEFVIWFFSSISIATWLDFINTLSWDSENVRRQKNPPPVHSPFSGFLPAHLRQLLSINADVWIFRLHKPVQRQIPVLLRLFTWMGYLPFRYRHLLPVLQRWSAVFDIATNYSVIKRMKGLDSYFRFVSFRNDRHHSVIESLQLSCLSHLSMLF